MQVTAGMPRLLTATAIAWKAFAERMHIALQRQSANGIHKKPWIAADWLKMIESVEKWHCQAEDEERALALTGVRFVRSSSSPPRTALEFDSAGGKLFDLHRV